MGARRWVLGVGKGKPAAQQVQAARGWIAALGPNAESTELDTLGPGAEIHRGEGWLIAAASAPYGSSAVECLAEGIYSITTGYSRASRITLDLRTQNLQLATDPFGLSAAYWRRERETTWCASSPLLLEPAHSFRLDLFALHGYLCFSFVPQSQSIRPAAPAVPAGGTWTLNAQRHDSLVHHQWSETSHSRESGSRSETLLDLLRTSVLRCLDGETEASVFLSGGLDSSLVAALLVEAGVRVHLFTLDFGEPWNQELAYAAQVARHLDRPLHVVPARPAEVRRHLEDTAAAMDQPFGDAVTVPLYLLGKAAAQVCPLVFNGEGGDQLFGGWANKPMIAAELYGGAGYDRLDAYMATFHRFWGLTNSLYTPGAREQVAGVDARDWVRSALEAPGCASLLHKLRAANLVLKGAQNIAPRAVQLGASHALEVRCPFFDRELADWTFSLPPEVFLQGACEKYLLKQVAERYLPAEVVWREKRGMGVPSAEWCLGPLQREIRHHLGKQRLRRDGWFEPRVVEALCKGIDQPGEFRSRRLGEKLWLLLMLHVWMDVRGVER